MRNREGIYESKAMKDTKITLRREERGRGGEERT